MAQLNYTVKVNRFKVPRKVKKAIKAGANYKLKIVNRKSRFGEVITVKTILEK